MSSFHLKAKFLFSDGSKASGVKVKVHEVFGGDYDLGSADSNGAIDKDIRDRRQVSVIDVPTNPLHPTYHNVDDALDQPGFEVTASDNQGHSFTTPPIPHNGLNDITIRLTFTPRVPFRLKATFLFSDGTRAASVSVQAIEVAGSTYNLGNTDGSGNIDQQVRDRRDDFDNPPFVIRATDNRGQSFTTPPVAGTALSSHPDVHLPFSTLIPFRLKTTFYYSNAAKADNVKVQVREPGGNWIDLGRTDSQGRIDILIRDRTSAADHPLFNIKVSNRYGHSFTSPPIPGDQMNPNPDIVLPFADPASPFYLSRNVVFPDSGELSTLLRERLIARWGTQVPGCIFHVSRNGQPIADGSFNYARLPGSSDGESAMNQDSIVHTGSVGKVIAFIAFLRLVQEWNEAFQARQNTGTWPTMGPGDQQFRQTIINFNKDLKVADANERFFPLFNATRLVSGYLDASLIATYGTYPGTDVDKISLRDLIAHQSGLPNPGATPADDYDIADVRGVYASASRQNLKTEPVDGAATFDGKKILTALFKKNRTADRSYNNYNTVVLGALIEALTGRLYADWVRERLFRGDARFDTINRHVLDSGRGARYYGQGSEAGEFLAGTLHPDYERFSADGGWYMSGRQFCDWFDAIMQGAAISGTVVLNAASIDLVTSDTMSGFWQNSELGRLDLMAKNGSAGPGGGGTNAVFGYMRGYGSERICAFTEANVGGVSADQIFNDGLSAVKTILTGRPGPMPSTIQVDATNTGFPKRGLLQYIYGAGTSNALISAAQIKEVTVENIGATSAKRTNLFGNRSVPSGFALALSDACMMELQGMLNVDVSGDYLFRLTSDDGAVLWVDNKLLVDFNDSHALGSKDSASAVALEANHLYPLRIQWYNKAPGGSGLFLEWKRDAQPGFSEIPAANFVTIA